MRKYKNIFIVFSVLVFMVLSGCNNETVKFDPENVMSTPETYKSPESFPDENEILGDYLIKGNNDIENTYCTWKARVLNDNGKIYIQTVLENDEYPTADTSILETQYKRKGGVLKQTYEYNGFTANYTVKFSKLSDENIKIIVIREVFSSETGDLQNDIDAVGFKVQ